MPSEADAYTFYRSKKKSGNSLLVVGKCFIVFLFVLNIGNVFYASPFKSSDTLAVRQLNSLAREVMSTDPERAYFLTAKAYKTSIRLSYPYGLALSLNGMGNAQYFLGNYTKALDYYEQSLQIFKKTGDTEMEATLYANIGNINHISGSYDKALVAYKNSLNLAIMEGLAERAATTLGSMGILYYDKSAYAMALKTYLKALKIREYLNDKQGMAYTLSNIGLIFDDQALYSKALQYYNKSLGILREINDRNGIAATLNNIGLVYYNLSSEDTALLYFNQSLEIAQTISSKAIIRSCYNNMGDIYKSKGQLKLAAHYYALTQEINAELNDTRSMAITLNSMADLYRQQGDKLKALSVYNQSLVLAEQTGDKFMIKENYKSMATLEAEAGMYKDAYNHFLAFYALHEELLTESQKQLSEIQHRYENERIENQVRLLTKETEVQNLLIERNKVILYATFTSVALLVLLIIIIYTSNRNKAKANQRLKLQNIIIEKQKEEIKSEKHRADQKILSILNEQDLQKPKDTASIDDYEMVAALFKKLEEEKIHARFEALKSEVNPHFLFNSLNNLVGLIEENRSVAANYVQELSSVYLYVLRTKDKEVVELGEEIAFVKSYTFLLQRRFGENLILDIHIDKENLKTYLPPLCLQLLIENAAKHNIVTATKPLTINIYVVGNTIVVKNNLQPKAVAEPSTKIGLSNIEKRYSMLTTEKTEIIKTRTEFTVKLPLIDLGKRL